MSKQNKHKHASDKQPSVPVEAEIEVKAAADTDASADTAGDIAATPDAAAQESVTDAQPVTDTAELEAEAEAEAEEAEADTKAEASSDAPASTPPHLHAPQSNGGGGAKALSALAIVIALAGAGASAWFWANPQQSEVTASPAPVVEAVDTHAEIEQLGKKLTQQLNDRLSVQATQLGALSKQVEQFPSAAELAQTQQRLQQMHTAQQAFTLRFESAFGNTRQDWRLAEAEHLLRMASLRLSALQDLNSARHLVEAADQILFEQDDPAAYAARDAIVKALADIQAMPKLDRAGIFMRLGALQKQVGELDQVMPEFGAGDSTLSSAMQSWQAWLDSVSDYIRIDFDSEQSNKPLMSSQELNHIRLAVSLSLEQAQWAALNGVQDVYDQALQQGTDLLSYYFANDNHVAQSMREQLQALTNATVSQSMPEIHPALIALQAYIQERTLQQRAPEVQP